MKIYFNLIILILSFVSAVNSQTETCLQNLSNSDNRTISQVIGSDTITREYIIKVPQNYNGNNQTPLIINMHGFGDCASDYSETIGDFYDFATLAENENIIVVYPQGAYRSEKEDTYWEPGDNGMDNIYDNDVYFIEKLVSDVQAEYNINSDMIYACGYSNGGMMAYSLACNRSQLFSAIGIISGTMLEENCFVQRAVPIVIFHGIEDEVLPYDGSLWYQSVEEVVSFWLEQNSIPDNSLTSSELNNGKVTLDQYYASDDNNCLNLYTILEEYDKPGGHVWFSDEINGSTPNELMWDFFKGNCSTASSTDKTEVQQVNIFPNPVIDVINLITEDNLNIRSTLYDLQGKQVLSTNNSDKMEIGGIPSGLYIFEIEDSKTGQKVIERIVIMR